MIALRLQAGLFERSVATIRLSFHKLIALFEFILMMLILFAVLLLALDHFIQLSNISEVNFFVFFRKRMQLLADFIESLYKIVDEFIVLRENLVSLAENL